MSDLSNGVTTALCSREHIVPFHLQIDSHGYTTPERVVATDEREKDVDESGPCFAGPLHTTLDRSVEGMNEIKILANSSAPHTFRSACM